MSDEPQTITISRDDAQELLERLRDIERRAEINRPLAAVEVSYLADKLHPVRMRIHNAMMGLLGLPYRAKLPDDAEPTD